MANKTLKSITRPAARTGKAAPERVPSRSARETARETARVTTPRNTGLPRLYKRGDTSVGICRGCQRRVETRFEYRDIPLENPATVTRHVLVGLCEHDHIVSIPWQSNHLLQAARRRAQLQLSAEARLEARVPEVLVEELRVIAATFDALDETLRAPLIRFYLHQVTQDPTVAQRARELLVAQEAELGPADARVSVRVPRHLRDSALSAARAAGIEDLSTLVRGLISVAWEDVNQGQATQRYSGLAGVAAALA